MKKGNLLNEVCRDILALGSPIFFILVLVRISIAQNVSYLSQFVISGILFFILMFLFKANMYSGLGLILLFFTAVFYNYLPFTIFGALAYLGLIFSLFYLHKEKVEIFKGVLLGAISTGIGYYAVILIFG